jgi:hypothetical protein
MSPGDWFPEKPDPLITKVLEGLEPLVSVGSDPCAKLTLLIVTDEIDIVLSSRLRALASVNGRVAGHRGCGTRERTSSKNLKTCAGTHFAASDV